MFHDLGELTFEHGDGVVAAFCAEGADAIHEGAAEEGELGSAGEGAGDVGAVADSAIEHEGGAVAEFLGESGEGFDGGFADVELSAAVVGDDHAIDPEADGLFGVLGIDDAFDDELAFPAVADGGDLIGVESPGEGLVHEETEVLHAEAFWGVRFHCFELGRSGEELAKAPGRAGHHLEDIAERHLGWDGKAVADFLGTPAEGGGVGEDDEGGEAGIVGAVEELVAQVVFGRMVELEPGVAIGELGDGFDIGRADGAEDEGDVVLVGGGGENLGGFGPHQALETDGGDAEGGIVGFPEEFGGEIGAGVVIEIPGLELDVANLLGVPVEIHLGEAAAREIFVGKARHALLGFGAEEFDGCVLGMDFLTHEMDGKKSKRFWSAYLERGTGFSTKAAGRWFSAMSFWKTLR